MTRADMAGMLVAAFAHLSAPDRARGLFTDMAGLTDAAVRAIEGNPINETPYTDHLTAAGFKPGYRGLTWQG